MVTAFAERALDDAAVDPSDRVLDVCAGPGSLTVPASDRAAHVTALDFSEPMLERLRARVKGRANVDRAAGFRELHRVLVPGGRAVVSSWTPMGGVPLRAEMSATGFEVDVRERVLPRMESALGSGPQRVEMRALFGVGRRPMA